MALTLGKLATLQKKKELDEKNEALLEKNTNAMNISVTFDS